MPFVAGKSDRPEFNGILSKILRARRVRGLFGFSPSRLVQTLFLISLRISSLFLIIFLPCYLSLCSFSVPLSRFRRYLMLCFIQKMNNLFPVFSHPPPHLFFFPKIIPLSRANISLCRWRTH